MYNTSIKRPSIFKTMKAQQKYYIKHGLDSRLDNDVSEACMLDLYVYMFNDRDTHDHSVVINNNACLIKRNFAGCRPFNVDNQIDDAIQFFRQQGIKFPYYDLILDLGVSMPEHARGFKLWVTSYRDDQLKVSLRDLKAL